MNEENIERILTLFEHIMRPTMLMYFIPGKSQVKGQDNKI